MDLETIPFYYDYISAGGLSFFAGIAASYMRNRDGDVTGCALGILGAPLGAIGSIVREYSFIAGNLHVLASTGVGIIGYFIGDSILDHFYPGVTSMEKQEFQHSLNQLRDKAKFSDETSDLEDVVRDIAATIANRVNDSSLLNSYRSEIVTVLEEAAEYRQFKAQCYSEDAHIFRHGDGPFIVYAVDEFEVTSAVQSTDENITVIRCKPSNSVDYVLERIVKLGEEFTIILAPSVGTIQERITRGLCAATERSYEATKTLVNKTLSDDVHEIH